MQILPLYLLQLPKRVRSTSRARTRTYIRRCRNVKESNQFIHSFMIIDHRNSGRQNRPTHHTNPGISLLECEPINIPSLPLSCRLTFIPPRFPALSHRDWMIPLSFLDALRREEGLRCIVKVVDMKLEIRSIVTVFVLACLRVVVCLSVRPLSPLPSFDREKEERDNTN